MDGRCTYCKHGFLKIAPKEISKNKVSKSSSVSSFHQNKATSTRIIKNQAKPASSESKLGSKSPARKSTPKNKSDKRPHLAPERLKQLQRDLTAIREQLVTLTKNKNIALDITHEVQMRYRELLCKSKKQYCELERLKRENQQLSGNNRNNNGLGESKKTVSFCEVDTCEAGPVSLSRDRTYDRNESSYDELMRGYQEAKERELHFERENRCLCETVDFLKNKLDMALRELETLRHDANLSRKQYLEEANRCKCYMNQVNDKSKKVQELSTTITHLEKQICSGSKTCAEIDANYQKLLVQYKSLELKIKIAEENEKRWQKEMKLMKENEAKLLNELEKLKKPTDKTHKSKSNEKSLMAKKSSHQTFPNCVSKVKKGALALVPRKNVQIQDDKLGANQHQAAVLLNSDYCQLELSNELQGLVKALYNEIDKTICKDAHVQSQCESISCAECGMFSQAHELNQFRNEVQTLRRQLNGALVEKENLAENLMFMESEFRRIDIEEYELECECVSEPEIHQ